MSTPRQSDGRRSTGRMNIALVQMSCVADKRRNVDKALARIGEAAAAGANIVCLQELFAGLYPCQSEEHARFDEAEPIPGPTSEALAGRAPSSTAWWSWARCSSAGRPALYHNTAVIFDADGRTPGMYRKMHIPDDPLYYEKFYFTPGDLGFAAFDTRFGRLGPLRLLGSVVSRGGAADGAARARRSCSIPRRSAGCTRRRRNTAPASTRPGKR